MAISNSFWDTYNQIQAANGRPTVPAPTTPTPSPVGTPATRTANEIRARMMGLPTAQLNDIQNNPNYGALQTYNTATGANEFTPKSTVAAFPYNYTQFRTFSGASAPNNLSTTPLNPTTYTPQTTSPAAYYYDASTGAQSPLGMSGLGASSYVMDPMANIFAWALQQQSQRNGLSALMGSYYGSPYAAFLSSQAPQNPSLPQNNTFTPTLDNITSRLGVNNLSSMINNLYTQSPLASLGLTGGMI